MLPIECWREGGISDVVEPGDEIEVVVINVDDRGKIELSHRQTLAEAQS